MNDADFAYIVDRTRSEVVETVIQMWKQLDVFLRLRERYEWWERAVELDEDPLFMRRGAFRTVFIGVRASYDDMDATAPHYYVEVSSSADDGPRRFGAMNLGSVEYLLEALEWRIEQPDRLS